MAPTVQLSPWPSRNADEVLQGGGHDGPSACFMLAIGSSKINQVRFGSVGYLV